MANNILQPRQPNPEYKLPRKVLIALPPAMLRHLDHIAFTEHRTRSDAIREAIRDYMLKFDTRQEIRGQAKLESLPKLAVIQNADGEYALAE